MLGPFRSCMYPSTLRSSNVRKATARSTGTIRANKFVRYIRLLKRGFEPLIVKA